jgi:hypothetical protein
LNEKSGVPACRAQSFQIEIEKTLTKDPLSETRVILLTQFSETQVSLIECLLESSRWLFY